MIDLLRFKKNQKYLFFDFETTNINLMPGANNNRIWQSTFFVTEGQKIINKFDTYPEWTPLPMSKGAAEVTRFNYDTYKKRAENPKKLLELFDSYLYDESFLIVGHNLLGFDIYQHNIWRNILGYKTDYSYLNRVLDTHCLSKALLLNRKPEKGESLIAFQYKMNSIIKKGLKTNLAAMGKHFSIDFDPSLLHDAQYDLGLNVSVYFKLIYQLDI